MALRGSRSRSAPCSRSGLTNSIDRPRFVDQIGCCGQGMAKRKRTTNLPGAGDPYAVARRTYEGLRDELMDEYETELELICEAWADFTGGAGELDPEDRTAKYSLTGCCGTFGSKATTTRPRPCQRFWPRRIRPPLIRPSTILSSAASAPP